MVRIYRHRKKTHNSRTDSNKEVTMDVARVRGAFIFLGAVLAAMIFWHFIIRLFTIHHPNNAAAQALAQLM